MEDKEKIITEEKAWQRMARLCARKEYCIEDIRRKLRKLNLSDKDIESVLVKLQKRSYVDDGRFARGFIRDKLHLNKWGKRKIEMALKQKKISPEVIEAAFSELPDGADLESLQPLLEKKWRTVKAQSVYEKRSKVIRFALGRGFPMDDVLRCFDKMQIDDDNKDDSWSF
ncbi:MAG TPA: RecX family transcriptional regulator [Porphyromonadaceae bacterium]|nr:RecX family transcriptional regulator [Porphyromonadaceae bacterium]